MNDMMESLWNIFFFFFLQNLNNKYLSYKTLHLTSPIRIMFTFKISIHENQNIFTLTLTVSNSNSECHVD